MSTEQRSLKVFLCHASADKPKVRELYRYLRRRGIKPWFDEVDLVGGQDWQIEIPKALATSDAIIVCLTKNSVDKEGYVQKEIKFALEKALEIPEGRIFLIPVRFEDCNVPFTLSRYQWVDLYNEGGFSHLTRALKERARQLERSNIELAQFDNVNLNQTVMTEQSSIHNFAREITITEFFFRIYEDIDKKYFPYFLIACLILGAILGGFLWNVLNVLLGWTFQAGGSGNEPHGVQAYIWGVVSFFPVLFFASLAGLRYLILKRISLGKWGIIAVSYAMFAGFGAVLFYDLGFRNFVEMFELGYGIQELIIVCIWSLVVSASISVPLLVLNRAFPTFINPRFIFLQIPLAVILAFLAILVSLFIQRPESEVAQLRGVIASIALRGGLFIGMYLAISQPAVDSKTRMADMKTNEGKGL